MSDKLALNGGEPIRKDPMPARGLFGEDEKAAAVAVFDDSIAAGEAFGYNGPKEAEYEAAFSAFMGGGFADGVNSGSNALFVALGALRLDALSEVIVPPISDPGGVMPVLFQGCVPIAADAEPGTYNISASSIRDAVTERTRAVIVAHIAGELVDMDPVLDIAGEKGLYVIEDCAQAHGATYKGKTAGTLGHVAAFSTMSGKHHATGAQGGVFYTRDEKLHWEGRRFADRGKPFNLDNATANVVAGLNCNSNDLSAAIGIVQLAKLRSIVDSRRRFVTLLKDRLAGETQSVRLGKIVPESDPVYWFVRLRLDVEVVGIDKAMFCEALAAEGIPVTPSYRHIPVEMPWFRNQAVFGSTGFPWRCSDYAGEKNPVFDLPNAIAATEEHFNLNINERFNEREADDIVRAIKKIEACYII